MEINRDEIIKALECCLTLEYGVACKGCPLSYKDERRMDCLELLMKSALSIIKELTEENERLSAYNENLIKTNTYLSNRLLDEVEQAKDLAISDTVKKMHSEIEARCIKGGIYPAFVASTIDQIAKEMMEGV